MDIYDDCPGGSSTGSMDWQVPKNIVPPATLIIRGIAEVIQLHN